MRTATAAAATAAADWRLTRVSIYVAVEGNLGMLWRGATRHLVHSLLPMGVPVHVKIAFALATHGIDDVKPLYLPVTAH
jgi:hypothetical protein